MNIEEIKKDLAILITFNKKRQELNKQLTTANDGRPVWFGKLQTELNKQDWANEYYEVAKKYDKLFTENKVYLEPNESSPLEDFLTIAIAINRLIK